MTLWPGLRVGQHSRNWNGAQRALRAETAGHWRAAELPAHGRPSRATLPSVHATPARMILRAGPAEAVLDPGAGGRIAALRVDGQDLLLTEGYGPLAWGAYPMVPWAGRLRDGILRWDGAEHALPTHLIPPHAIHGTLVETAWDLVDPVGASAAVLEAPLGPPWPFGGRAVHRVSLAADD